MASYISPFPAVAPSISPFQDNISVPLSAAQQSATDLENEEWEYEYSATETETYYVTLDLTTPSTISDRAQFPKAGRGGYKATWINPTRRRGKQPIVRASTLSLHKGGGRESVSAQNATTFDEEEIEDDDEVSNNVGVGGEDDPIENELVNHTAAAKDSGPETIQILGLHTDNPVITYKGHIFSCNWAQNIGTELIFTFRDHDNPLPIVRSLPDDVELLAASSARLTSKCVTLTTNRKLSNELDTDQPYHTFGSLGSLRQGGGRPGVLKTTRKEQANFLERVINMKRKKGESDSVTTIAQKRLYPSQWRIIWKQRRENERKELRSTVQRGGQIGQQAADRLAEMEKEDNVRDEMEKSKKGNRSAQLWKSGRKSKEVDGDGPIVAARGRPAVRRRPRGGKKAGLKHVGPPVDTSTAELAPAGEDQDIISTPTPQRWADLNHGSGSNDENDREEEEEDDDDMEDV